MDLQTVSIVLTGTSVSIAAIYYVLTLRNTYRTRQAQLFMDLYRNWTSPEMSKIYGRTRYGKGRYNLYEYYMQCLEDPADPKSIMVDFDRYSDIGTLSNFFEGIGVLVRRRLIDLDLVEDLFSQRIIWWWEAFRPISHMAREVTGDPTQHANTEWLYNESIKRREQQSRTKH